MRTRTKIVCTMGPSVQGLDKVLELIDAGMNVARINFSHGTQQEHLVTIETLKKARALRKTPLAIMLDTKGPEIRIGVIKGEKLEVKAKQKILLVKKKVEGDTSQWQITPEIALKSVKIGDAILFDDGYISSKVVSVSSEGVLVELQNEGIIKSHKGVNIPGVAVDLPAMTEQDIKDIIFGCQQDVDLIAASFIRSAEHVLEIKRLLIEQRKANILVIAKIENSLGVQNFDNIIQVADGIMVARGDLGVELPLKQVPSLQKMMIRKCYEVSKPVVTATQMLESMISNPRPTRAEVSDVANAIFDSTSAVMLSGETAVGKYPIETVAMMKSIIEEAEKEFNYEKFFQSGIRSFYQDVSSSVALACVSTAYSAHAKAIFAFTNSGSVARIISSFRPKMPLLALTPHIKTYHQLAFNWGVIPVDPATSKNVQEAFTIASCFAMKSGLVQYGDLVIVTAGSPFGVSGTTNTMMVESIGDVLVRGSPSHGERVHGKVALVLSAEEIKPASLKGHIAVISCCTEVYLPLLKYAIGIVLQNHPEDLDSEKRAATLAKTLGIPLIIRAGGALSVLKDGQLVTLDPERGILYKGAIGTDEEMLPTICKTKD